MATNLSASVANGVVDQYQSAITQKKSTVGTSELGKDAFLQLLVTQMQCQDPLNPSSDTEFISQLATFSSLEQMQNLNSTFSQTQAFSLVGQQVQVSADNKVGYVEGTVDYVTISNGNTYLSVNGTLYSSDKLITVVDSLYVAKQNAPTIESQTVAYDHENPEDIKVKINLGTDTGAASSFAVILNGEVLDPVNLGFDPDTNTVTISKNALKGLEAGSYKVMFLFDDKLETTVTDKVVLNVKGVPEKTEETDKTEETEGDNTEGDKTEAEDSEASSSTEGNA